MSNLRVLPAALALCVLPLAACSSSQDDDAPLAANCGDFPAGAISDTVTVTGEFGEPEPQAEFSQPLEVAADDLQRTILDAGDGDQTAEGDQIEAVISVFNGRTGELALSEHATLTAGDDDTFEAFAAALDCVPIGSRVVTTVAAGDVYGDEGYPELELEATDALVIVTDLTGVREEITAQEWSQDVPEVSLDGDEPDVTIPDVDPPTDVRVAVVDEGDGDVVAAGDTITVNYQGRTWESGGEIFQQTFGPDGEPTPLSTDQVVQGFKAGVVGQKVGSTVLIGIPPEYGYGTEESEENELGGKTLVFVVEIVSIDS